MAAGMDYSDYTVLDEYPCDVESIVRYRGGFNLHSQMIADYEGCTFPVFTPMWVSLTTREVYPLVVSWDATPDSTLSTDTNYIVKAFLYNRLLVEKGSSVTLVLRANEVLFSALNNMKFLVGSAAVEDVITPYQNLTTLAANRTALMNAIPNCMYCWA